MDPQVPREIHRNENALTHVIRGKSHSEAPWIRTSRTICQHYHPGTFHFVCNAKPMWVFFYWKQRNDLFKKKSEREGILVLIVQIYLLMKILWKLRTIYSEKILLFWLIINLMSLYFQTAFDDVLAEVDGTHSIDCIWKASYACFHGCKSCCYNIFTFFCGIWIACFWGLDFALISFAHVWCVTPILRMCMIHFNLCQKTFGTWVNCCCAPCCEVFSLIFSNIRVEKR